MSIHLNQTRRPSSDFWEWLFYSHNGIKSITIIGLLTLWGQDLEFDNHTQSIINEFPISFKGNIHFGLEVAALPGARARPTDIVWDQVHKKIREGKSWPARNPTFHGYLLKAFPDQIILHRLQRYFCWMNLYKVFHQPRLCLKGLTVALN